MTVRQTKTILYSVTLPKLFIRYSTTSEIKHIEINTLTIDQNWVHERHALQISVSRQVPSWQHVLNVSTCAPYRCTQRIHHDFRQDAEFKLLAVPALCYCILID